MRVTCLLGLGMLLTAFIWNILPLTPPQALVASLLTNLFLGALIVGRK